MNQKLKNKEKNQLNFPTKIKDKTLLNLGRIILLRGINKFFKKESRVINLCPIKVLKITKSFMSRKI